MTSLRDELERVRAERGKLTPAAVVDAARPEDHPLHSRFEWNDSVAGEKYRQVQAAELIRSYRITYTEADETPKSVRGYLAVRGTDDGPNRDYLPTEQVMTDPFLRKLALAEMERDMRALKAKYGHLEEYGAMLVGVAA